MAEVASWNLRAKLYQSALSFTDGRITKFKDEKTGATRTETGRRKANLKEGRVVWCDADTATPDKFRLRPSAIIQSSNGRFQLYWRLESVHAAWEILEVVNKIALAHSKSGADLSSGAGGTKLALVPGCKNTKRYPDDYAKDPSLAGQLVHPDKPRVTLQYTGETYTLEQIRAAYSDVDLKPDVQVELNNEIPSLLPWDDAFGKLPSRSSTGQDFFTLATEPEKEGSDRSEYLFLLLCECYREGLTPQEILTVAWAAPAATKWSKEDSRGIGGLWGEVQRAIATVDAERGTDVGPPEPVEQINISATELLSAEEIENRRGSAFYVDQYQENAASQLVKANMPYHKANAWSTLSAAYSMSVAYVENSRKVPCNLWVMSVGETGTGKGDARKIYEEVMDAVSPGGWDGNVNIGSNAHVNTLTDILLERDGQVSTLFSDEADGVFSVLRDQKWTTGSLQSWTDWFDGKVNPIIRKDKKGVYKGARTLFLVWFQGTPEKISNVLTRDMFDSGFLPRFVWYVGEKADLDPDEAFSITEGDLDVAQAGTDPWIVEVGNHTRRVRQMHGTVQEVMPWDQEAIARVEEAWKAMYASIEGSAFSMGIQQSHRRMGMHMRKAATLNATHEGRDYVSVDDALVAIDAAQDWWKNLRHMVASISSSPWAKSQDEILEWLRTEGGESTLVKFNTRFRDIEKRIREQLIAELVVQGWVKEFKTQSGRNAGKFVYKLEE